MEKPLKYFDNNTSGMVRVAFEGHERMWCQIHCLLINSCDFMVFLRKFQSLKPHHKTQSILTVKVFMMETIMKWSDQAYGIKYVPLRYFNVAGVKPDGSIGEDRGPETHLLPIILQVAPRCS